MRSLAVIMIYVGLSSHCLECQRDKSMKDEKAGLISAFVGTRDLMVLRNECP